MNKYIFVNMNMFALQSSVFIIDADQENSREFIDSYLLEELPNALVNLAHEKGIYDVKINNSGKYSQLIEYEIGSKEVLKYSERKIEIEVI